MKKVVTTMLCCLLAVAILTSADSGCQTQTADKSTQEQQEKVQAEGVAQAGLPDIHNFTEKKMVKMLYELRDNPNLINFAYTYSEVTGKMTFIGKCIGYGIPYATQYSNPEKDIYLTTASSEHHNMPQSEPNGLFMPSSAEGTWLMLINPETNKPVPVYIEPKVIISPFRFSN